MLGQSYISSLRAAVARFSLFLRTDIVTTGTILDGSSGCRIRATEICLNGSFPFPIMAPGLNPPIAIISVIA
jgi:hypothetical protein